ncbi:hypothetical protein [uncultured Tateyamaria sp.]|uniref:hypothetical protein n=1 Tax=uncultured Tateyamaria sp. TaxID=455651 RepID=UPI002626DB60|nr:hypothetical protein [uncultured Tateyamaria sp.]
MTIIASVTGKNSFYQISDILITRNASDHEGRTIATPLLPDAGRDIRSFSQQYFLSKTLISQNGILASFSGSVLKGTLGLKIIEKQSLKVAQEFSLEPALEALNSYFDQDGTDDVSFIISIVRPKGQGFELLSNSFNCRLESTDNFSIRLSGSGVDLFIDPNFISTFDGLISESRMKEGTQVDDTTRFVFSRISRLLTLSLVDETFEYFRFGGWYELFCASAAGFQRLNYSVVVLSEIQPNFVITRYASLVELDEHIFIAEIIIDNQGLVHLRSIEVRNPLKQRVNELDQHVHDRVFAKLLAEQPEMMLVLWPVAQGRIASLWTDNLPFKLATSSDDEIHPVIDDENLQLLRREVAQTFGV